MNITVLLFREKTAMDDKVHQALIDSGIRVRCVNKLSQIYNSVESECFDALLVGKTLIERYKMHPGKQLWERRSPVNIMVWKYDETNVLKTEIFCLPDHITGIPSTADRKQKLETIKTALGSVRSDCAPAIQSAQTATEGFAECAAELSPAYSSCPFPEFPPETDILLHKKLRTVLKTIAQTGKSGAEIKAITETVWPADIRDRKKDIQIYVCRLRHILARTFGSRYHILLVKDRYILVDKGPSA